MGNHRVITMISKGTTRNRGQTLPDYAIAFGIFMLAILIAFSSSSELFDPYQSEQERISESNRIGNQLVQTTLISDQTQQYILDEECTVSAFQAFKGNSTTIYDKCYYTDNIDDSTYREYMGMKEQRSVNVALINSSGATIQVNGVTLTFGSNVPDVANTTNSYRMVKLNGAHYRLRVTTW